MGVGENVEKNTLKNLSLLMFTLVALVVMILPTNSFAEAFGAAALPPPGAYPAPRPMPVPGPVPVAAPMPVGYPGGVRPNPIAVGIGVQGQHSVGGFAVARKGRPQQCGCHKKNCRHHKRRARCFSRNCGSGCGGGGRGVNVRVSIRIGGGGGSRGGCFGRRGRC